MSDKKPLSSFTHEDERFMRRALQIADEPESSLLPNPRVGAVLVSGGKNVAEGFHSGPGKPHAEAECLKAAEAQGFQDFENARMYVSLEPCVHTSKRTPPCAPLLIEKKIGRVIVCHLDPNPKVSGRGVAALEAAGIKTEVGLLDEAGIRLNQAFFKSQKKKLPYITMKLALSFDGKMATDEADSQWITNEKSREQVHHLRKKVQAIVVGKGTIEKDEPKLNVRLGSESIDRSIVIFGNPKNLSSWAKKRKLPAEKLIVVSKSRPKFKACEWIKRSSTPKEALKSLKLVHKIEHVLVEAGPQLASLFLQEKLVDELILYYGSGFIGGRGNYAIGRDWRLKKLKDSVKFRALETSLVDGDVRVRGLLHVYRTDTRNRKSSKA